MQETAVQQVGVERMIILKWQQCQVPVMAHQQRVPMQIPAKGRPQRSLVAAPFIQAAVAAEV